MRANAPPFTTTELRRLPPAIRAAGSFSRYGSRLICLRLAATSVEPPERKYLIDRDPAVADYGAVLVVCQSRIGRATAGQHQIPGVVGVLETEIVPELVADEHAEVLDVQPAGARRVHEPGLVLYGAAAAPVMRGRSRDISVETIVLAVDQQLICDESIDVVVRVGSRPLVPEIPRLRIRSDGLEA